MSDVSYSVILCDDMNKVMSINFELIILMDSHQNKSYYYVFYASLTIVQISLLLDVKQSNSCGTSNNASVAVSGNLGLIGSLRLYPTLGKPNNFPLFSFSPIYSIHHTTSQVYVCVFPRCALWIFLLYTNHLRNRPKSE